MGDHGRRRAAGPEVGKPDFLPFVPSHHVQPAPAAAAPAAAPAAAAAVAAAPAAAPAAPAAGPPAHGHEQVSSPGDGWGAALVLLLRPRPWRPLLSPSSQRPACLRPAGCHFPSPGGQRMEGRVSRKRPSREHPDTRSQHTQGAPPAAATAAAPERPGHQRRRPPQWLRAATASFAFATVARYGHRPFSLHLVPAPQQHQVSPDPQRNPARVLLAGHRGSRRHKLLGCKGSVQPHTLPLALLLALWTALSTWHCPSAYMRRWMERSVLTTLLASRLTHEEAESPEKGRHWPWVTQHQQWPS